MKHQDTWFSHTKSYKAVTPSTSQIVEADEEIRIELPFYLLFESLAYIGVVLRETRHVRPHYHEHFELCYVDKGQGWFAIDEFTYQAKQGDLFLTKPGENHQGTAVGNSPFRLYYLGFQLNMMNALEMDYYQLGIHRVVQDQAEIIKGIFAALFDELRSNQKHSFEMVQAFFLRLLVQVLRTYEHVTQIQDNTPLAPSPVLRQVLYYLHAEVGSYQSVDDLASKVYISRSHLTREFKRYVGVSLGQYMRSLRLDWAKHYLRETSDTVSSIAEHLHFPSLYTFSIFFKRHTGLSPQEYRQQASRYISYESNV